MVPINCLLLLEPKPLSLNLACLLTLGLKGSLQRMQLEYVDVVFANRTDTNTPMEGKWLPTQTSWGCWGGVEPATIHVVL